MFLLHKNNLKKNKKKNLIVYIDQEFENSFEAKITNNKHNLMNKDKFFNCLDLIFMNLAFH